MVPLMMLLASCDTDASANGIKGLKGHVALHFDHLDVRNTMVPLGYQHVMLMPMTSVTKKSCCTHLDHLYLRNAVVPLMLLLG